VPAGIKIDMLIWFLPTWFTTSPTMLVDARTLKVSIEGVGLVPLHEINDTVNKVTLTQ
jgi:hypothetical protein